VSQWHAGIDKPSLGAGARLTVLSDHHVVRVITTDTLSIETPSGQRFSAVVLDRTAGDIKLILDDGTPISLGMLIDESLHPPGEDSDVFSRQVWVAH
jgi:hypothetical protein